MDTTWIILQTVSLIAILGVGVLGVFLPYFFRRCQRFDTIISYFSVASGGILFGASFIHMLPDATGELDRQASGFPVSFALFCLGMMIMIWISRVGGHGHGHMNAQDAVLAKQPQHSETRDTHSASQQSEERSLLREPGSESHGHNSEGGHMHDEPGRLLGDIENAPTSSSEHTHCEPRAAVKQNACQQFKSVIVLMIGLSVHSISAGVSLGLSTSVQVALGMTIAIVLHKWCVTVTTSLAGMRTELPKCKNILTGVGLSLATPVGQLIGIVIVLVLGKDKDDERTKKALDCIMDAFTFFASGTFVQIVFEEVLHHDLSLDACSKNRLTSRSVGLRMLCMFGGFAFMCVVSVLEGVIVPEDK